MTFTDDDLEAFIKNYAIDPVDEGAVARLALLLSTHPGADEAPSGFGCEIAGRYFSQDAIDAVLWPDLDAPEDSPHLSFPVRGAFRWPGARS